MTTMTETNRSVSHVVPSTRTVEGAGFVVHRPFPTAELRDVDPFLLLDHMGPMDFAPGEAKGAPDHPHAGFEVITYMLHGRMEHRDSQGHAGVLGPGDAQWMTAGRGIVHSEMPEGEFNRAGGRLDGLQLWINLPRTDKRMAPAYRDIAAAEIPVATNADGRATVKVLAGQALGVRGPITTRTPIIYQHWMLEPGARVVQPAPDEYNVLVYVLEGEGRFGAEQTVAGPEQLVLFEHDGGNVVLAAPANATAPLSVVLLAGKPLGEPVARYGPFVMNTQAEIVQVAREFREGRMGEIDR